MAISRSLLFLLPFLLAISSFRQAQSEESNESDLVTDLPGQPPVNFRHYAGYIRVRQEDERALFYWFFEAEGNASKKPLLLWLNGGPGCSSVAYGAAQELGPFLVRNNGTKLVLNKYSWNKVANILFVESPVGVGFSYTNRSQDLFHLGDSVTAEDSHAFLLNWFQKFPSFKSQDFYIAGESYAGHYVPQLANLIYERNKNARKNDYINFKGFMIGNAVLNDATDEMGMVEYAWSHAIISDQLYHSLNKDCNFNTENQSILCNFAMRNFLEAFSDIDIYSIYTPVCPSDVERASAPKLTAAPRSFSQHDLWHKLPSGYDPCTQDYAEIFFNREDVQKALHANVTKLSYPYAPCSIVIRNWSDSPATVLPILTKLLHAGVRIWVYSGDTDGRVPVTSTRYSINSMRLTVSEGWRAWFHKQQVAGWVVQYKEGLTFATLRGAGHQAPVFVPQQSLSLFMHFLAGRNLPASRF